MKKVIPFLILFVYVFSVAHSQDASKIPQLLNQLNNSKTDSSKVEAYRDLSFNYSHKSADTGIYYGIEGLKIAQRINFIKGIGDCYNSIGWCLIKKGDYKGAKVNLLLAKKYFEKISNNCYIAVVFSNLGSLFYNQNLYADALENYLQSVKLNESCADVGFKASAIYSIGTIYNVQKEHKQAIKYFEQAEKINILNADINKAAECYNGIGNAFLGMQKYDSAIVYLEKAMHLYGLFKNINGVGYVKESIGNIYLEQKNFKKALEYFEDAKKNFELLGSVSDVCYELTMISEAYHQMGDLNSAIQYQKTALQIADSNLFFNIKQTTLSSLANLYSLKKDYKNAYEYYKEYIFLKDSIASENQQIKLDELKTKFETEQKDKQIELLNKDKQIDLAESAKQKQLKNIFIAGALMLLVLAIVIFNRYQIKKKSAAELVEKNKIIEIEKDKAEKSEKFKQQFLANMSHEIRTPMNAILGMTELLEDAQMPIEQKKYFDAIKNSSQNLLVIVNDILDLSKLEAGKMSLESISFDLYKLIQNIKSAFQYKLLGKKVVLTIDIKKDVPQFIVSDPARLHQILMNLLGNAIKFTEKGNIDLSISNQNNILNFTIKDTGIGIPTEQLSKIFDSFTQSNSGNSRKYEGTGLGLTISKNLVELFGGTIKVSSEEHVGSWFSFFIPLTIGTKTTEKMDTTYIPENKIILPIHIILVEDNVYNRMLVIDGLKKNIKDIKFSIAENGNHAINLLKSLEPFENLENTIILMDISMPEMDGYETTKKIRKEFLAPIKDLPIIAVTASVIRSDLEKCMLAGMDDYIAKPFKIKELVSIVLEYAQSINSIIESNLILKNKHTAEQDNRITNFDYLNDFTEGDAKEIQKYISIFCNQIPIKLASAELAIKQENRSVLLTELHGMNSMLASVGCSSAEEAITYLQNNIYTINCDQILIKFQSIRSDCTKALQELKEVF